MFERSTRTNCCEICPALWYIHCLRYSSSAIRSSQSLRRASLFYSQHFQNHGFRRSHSHRWPPCCCFCMEPLKRSDEWNCRAVGAASGECRGQNDIQPGGPRSDREVLFCTQTLGWSPEGDVMPNTLQPEVLRDGIKKRANTHRGFIYNGIQQGG